MGGLARSLGWTKKAIKNGQDYLQGMERLRKTLDVSEQGASIGIMLQRLMAASQERQGQPDLLTRLGTAPRRQFRDNIQSLGKYTVPQIIE
jgi:hypothetical protein